MEDFTRKFGVGFLLCCALACWAWAVFAAIQFSPITTLVALGLSLPCIYLIAILNASRNVTVQAAFDATGTLIRPDKRIEKNMRRLVASGTLSMGLMFAAWAIGVLYLPLGEIQNVFPIVFGVAAVGLAWLWMKDSTQGGLSYLMLSPEGFEFAGFLTSKSGKWEEVRSVADKLPDEDRFWNPMVITMTNENRLLMEAPGTYTPKGTAIVDMVRFYWQHPEHRDELTDGRALRHLPISPANQSET